MLVGRNRSYGYTTDKEKAAQTAEFDFFGCRNRKEKKKSKYDNTDIYLSINGGVTSRAWAAYHKQLYHQNQNIVLCQCLALLFYHFTYLRKELNLKI